MHDETAWSALIMVIVILALMMLPDYLFKPAPHERFMHRRRAAPNYR
jgi:hypothetical protein